MSQQIQFDGRVVCVIAPEDLDKLENDLDDVRKVAELNNAAMRGTVLRLRAALCELTGDGVVIPSTPSALDNLNAVAHAQSEFDRIKLAE